MAALTWLLWGENMQSQEFEIIYEDFNGVNYKTESWIVSKWVDINDISGVITGGSGRITDPLHQSESYRMVRFSCSESVVNAVLNSAPDRHSIGNLSQFSPLFTPTLENALFIKIVHKTSGWYYRIRLYPLPASSTDANIQVGAQWGSDSAGETFGTNFSYRPQGTSFSLCAIYHKYTSSGTELNQYGFLVAFEGGAPTLTTTRYPAITGEESLYGTNIDPLPPAPTGGGGGNGTFDNRTDVNVNIGIKGSGFLSGILGSGFHFYYVPDYSELVKAMYYHINGVNNLSDWTNNTMALFLAPANYVVSATALPCNRNVFHPQGGVTNDFVMGGLLSWNVPCYKLSRLWGDSGEYYYDFGGKMYFDDYRDFEPFTKISLYLPYIGTVPLKASECNGGRISVVYRFEGISGKCLAMVKTTDRNGRQTGYYQYGGNAGFSLPWIGNNGGGSQMIHSAASAVAGMPELQSFKGGGQSDDLLELQSPFEKASEDAFFKGVGGIAASQAQFWLHDSRPHMQGGFGVNTGALGADDIVLIIQRAQFANPDNYYDIHGFQTATGGVCGDYSGYTEFNLVELVDCEATQPEQDEILQLLKRGVYL